MQELDEFKTFLGPIAADYTDAQLLQLRAEFNVMVELLLDIYAYRVSSDVEKELLPSTFDSLDR